MSRPREGGWPGRRWGEEPCVLLRVGIRPSRAFFTLIGTTPEPHTKSITSGAVGTQCGRAARDQWGGEAGLWASELLLRERRTTDFTRGGNKRAGGRKKERERGEIRGRFCVFVFGGERACCTGFKGLLSAVQGVSFSRFSSPPPNDWRWRDYCAFQTPA